MYNKKALLFDMEVGYQSELNWNCAVVQQYVPSIAKLKTSLIIPCQLGSFFPLLLTGLLETGGKGVAVALPTFTKIASE